MIYKMSDMLGTGVPTTYQQLGLTKHAPAQSHANIGLRQVHLTVVVVVGRLY